MLKPTTLQAGTHRHRLAAGGIDWEDLPSLTHLAASVDSSLGTGAAWAETLPAALDGLAPAGNAPARLLRHRLPGLEVREVNEPDVFELFFGRLPREAGGQRA